jgi:hypothetical protein
LSTQSCFGDAALTVLASACREARFNESEWTGTEHVLVALLRNMDGPADARVVLEQALRGGSEDAARTRGQADADPPGEDGDPHLDREISATLREATWRAARPAPSRLAPPPEWHPAVRAALRWALVDAAADGVHHPGLRYLLDAVLADPDGGARALVGRSGLDLPGLVAAPSGEQDRYAADAPRSEIVGSLAAYGVLNRPAQPGGFGLRVWILRRVIRRAGVDLMQLALELEAIRQAVRLGSSQVTTAHLLLATIELDRSLQAVGASLPDSRSAVSQAGQVLAQHGVDYLAAVGSTAELAMVPEPVAAVAPGPWWRKRRRWWWTDPRSPAWAASAGAAAEAAASHAARDQTRVGSSHLLIAAVADPDGPAGLVLRRLGADPAAVSEEAARRLSVSTG